MTKKTILLIEDDPKTEAGIREVLGEYELKAVSSAEAAGASIRERNPDLVIIDYDLRGIDGLRVFRQIHLLVPQVKVIMLSVANNITLAVTATKAGVADFLRKPVEAGALRLSVEKNLVGLPEAFPGPAEVVWLQGESDTVKKLYVDIQRALAASRNLILTGERGIEKGKLVEFMHACSLKKRRKLRTLDLSSFRRENLEAFFWAAAQEIMAEPEIGSPRGEEDRCGTLYLENIGTLDENFKRSVFEFFRRRKGNIDKEVLVIVGVYSYGEVQADMTEGYAEVGIPPLRERKEDLPYLLGDYLRFFSAKHNKKARGFSTELLEYLSAYDYPGNYEELEHLIEQGVLLASSEVLELKDIPLHFKAILAVSMKKAFRSGKLSFEEARREFEEDLYRVLLSKSDGDVAAAARFLDLPRTVLAERLENFFN